MKEFTIYDKTTGEYDILIGYFWNDVVKANDLEDKVRDGYIVLLSVDYSD